jgi:hypothetical protein
MELFVRMRCVVVLTVTFQSMIGTVSVIQVVRIDVNIVLIGQSFDPFRCFIGRNVTNNHVKSENVHFHCSNNKQITITFDNQINEHPASNNDDQFQHVRLVAMVFVINKTFEND